MNALFQIVGRRDIEHVEWDAFVDASDEAWLWHHYNFQDAIETWSGSNDESFAALTPDGTEILALVPLRRVTRRAAGLLPLHILESLGGPALRNGLAERSRRSVLKALREHIVKCARHGICLETRVTLPAMAPALRGPKGPHVNPLIQVGCDNTLTQTWVADLRAGRDAVWKSMEGRARTAVRKAEKAGVVVREAGPQDMETYYRLHKETYRRTGVSPHPEEYFRAIWDYFLAQGLARIWIAELDGEAIAAENFGIYKRAAIYWTGAASRKGLATDANSLLQWTAMQWMTNHDIDWYETGEAFPQFESGKLKGLSDFKRSFGGRLYPYFKGRVPLQTWYEKLYLMRQVLTR